MMPANRPPQTTHTEMADVEEEEELMALRRSPSPYGHSLEHLKDEKIAFLRSRIIGLYRALKEAQNG